MPGVQLVWGRHGHGLPDIGGADFVVRETYGCEFALDESCAETTRALYLQTLGLDEVFHIVPGEGTTSFSPSTGVEVDMQVMYARRRIVVDEGCAQGSSQMGDDLEAVAVVRGN